MTMLIRVNNNDLILLNYKIMNHYLNVIQIRVTFRLKENLIFGLHYSIAVL